MRLSILASARALRSTSAGQPDTAQGHVMVWVGGAWRVVRVHVCVSGVSGGGGVGCQGGPRSAAVRARLGTDEAPWQSFQHTPSAAAGKGLAIHPGPAVAVPLWSGSGSAALAV